MLAILIFKRKDLNFLKMKDLLFYCLFCFINQFFFNLNKEIERDFVRIL
jgi:hypothetical protein